MFVIWCVVCCFECVCYFVCFLFIVVPLPSGTMPFAVNKNSNKIKRVLFPAKSGNFSLGLECEQSVSSTQFPVREHRNPLAWFKEFVQLHFHFPRVIMS